MDGPSKASKPDENLDVLVHPTTVIVLPMTNCGEPAWPLGDSERRELDMKTSREY